jgi:hypothetical protein
MGLIYQNAQATIIAAAGDDPNYGFPGVRLKLRDPRPWGRIENHLLVALFPDPREIVRSSTRASRGWTFLEALFSRRRIIFTDQQVYFECDKMQCCEAADNYLAPLLNQR